MKILLFVSAVGVLVATGASAQGVDFGLGAPGVPPVSYTDGSGNALLDRHQPAPQHVRQHRSQVTAHRGSGYIKVARKKAW